MGEFRDHGSVTEEQKLLAVVLKPVFHWTAISLIMVQFFYGTVCNIPIFVSTLCLLIVGQDLVLARPL